MITYLKSLDKIKLHTEERQNFLKHWEKLGAIETSLE